jgi:uncharacterized protein (TIGR02217 family)
MAYHNVVFPTDISSNSQGGPGFRTLMSKVDSGDDERVATWSQPLWTFDVRYGIKTPAKLYALQEFFLCRFGGTFSFPYWDPNDYSTGLNGRAAPDSDDVEIATADGTDTSFQLFKTYTSGSFSFNRPISKIKAGTVVVAVDDVEQTEGVDFTVDSQTGIILFGTAPLNGEIITAGFEFYVPVHFAESADEGLRTINLSWEAVESTPIILEETRSGLQTPNEFNFRGASAHSFAADFIITAIDGLVQEYRATVTGVTGTLPAIADFAMGGPHFVLRHAGSNSISIEDESQSAVTTLTSANVKTLYVGTPDNAAKEWVVK